MADYYPLISRAVANLGPSTAEQRRELYTRATNALIGQLRNSEPPIAEADITRERLALEDAINRVETEMAGGVPRAAELPEEVFEPLPERIPQAEVVVENPLPSPSSRARPRRGRSPRRRWTSPKPSQTSRSAARSLSRCPSRPSPPAGRVPPPRASKRANRRWLRAAVIGLAIAVVVGLTATAAIMLKHQPADFQPQPPVAAAPTEAERKAQDRLPGEAPPPSSATAAAPAPAAPGRPPQPAAPSATAAMPSAPPPTAAPGEATVGIMQRVLLVEEPEQGSREFKQTAGRVRWRIDSLSAGAGQPLDTVVRADVEVPEAALKVELLLRRNRDAALPASHTLELNFSSAANAPNGPVRDVGVPEMRQDEVMRGTPLVGIAVPVTDKMFLTGLSNLPGDVQRNLELLRMRNWFMVPVRFTNGRRAVILIEKGPTGTRTIADAIESWRQG